MMGTQTVGLPSWGALGLMIKSLACEGEMQPRDRCRCTIVVGRDYSTRRRATRDPRGRRDETQELGHLPTLSGGVISSSAIESQQHSGTAPCLREKSQI